MGRERRRNIGNLTLFGGEIVGQPNVVIPSKENRLEAAFHTKAQAIRSTIRNSALWHVQQMFCWEKLG